MGISDEARRRIEEKKKTFDQRILDPNIFVKDFPLDPWSAYPKTNNFIQQSIARSLGYSPDEGKWVRLQVDEDGKLEVSGITLGTEMRNYWYDGTDWVTWQGLANQAPYVMLKTREAANVIVIPDIAIGAGQDCTHTAVDISGYRSMMFHVSSSANSTVYLQFSDDGTNWYDLKSVADDNRTWNCNVEKICVHGDVASRYMRVWIHATTASTVRAVLHLQV